MITNKQYSRIMALDVGDSRVGIAISDPMLITAQPLETVETAKAVQWIAKLIKEKQVAKLIVGLPLKLDGTYSSQTEKVTKFANKLEQFLTSNTSDCVSIEFWDERLTTQQAQKVIAGSKLKNKHRSAALDKISAALILQSYLSLKHNKTY